MAMADSTQPGKEDKGAERRRQLKAARMRAARLADPEEARAKDRARYQANKERILRKNKRYRERNAEVLRARAKARHAANPDPNRARYKLWREKNGEKKKASDRAYAAANKEAKAAAERERYAREREKILARNKAWREGNRHAVSRQKAAYQRKRRASDCIVRLVDCMRSRVVAALSRADQSKRQSTLSLIGCTATELKIHIESLFLPGMTWSNRGMHGWHVDHIIPLSKFDLSDPEQQAVAFHYTNLQPLCAADNLRKSNKVPGQNLFGFAHAARIADAASAKPKRRRKHGGQYGGH